MLSFLVFAVAVAAGYGAVAQTQQQAAPPCPTTESSGKANASSGTSSETANKTDKTPTPCVPSSKEPSAAERFPFPGETPAPPMPGASTPSPDAPAPQSHHPSATEEHPFPGSAPPMPGSDSESSSSSSSSSGDSSSSSNSDSNPETGSPPLDDKGDNPRASVRRRLPKVEKLQSDEERAAEDLNVAKFYEDKGDLNAAYLRTKDAVKVQPSDPEAHIALARVAQKMNKRDEAIAEYNAYLQLSPDGTMITQAQKALNQLNKH